MRAVVLFIPIITTVISFAFAGVVMARWMDRRATHLLWWAIGLLTYGAGTITESATTLLGWHEPVFRAWYITGALLGGAPLAQGSVYLHLSRRTAHWLTTIVATLIVVASVCVMLSPINYALVEPFLRGQTPKAGVLNINQMHTMEHYGNLVTYMRLKDIVPPTSDM